MAHSNSDKRRATRRAQKAGRKAAWATLIGTSRNKKAKQVGAVKKRSPAAKVPHKVPVWTKGKLVLAWRVFYAGPPCGNTGANAAHETV